MERGVWEAPPLYFLIQKTGHSAGGESNVSPNPNHLVLLIGIWVDYMNL